MAKKTEQMKVSDTPGGTDCNFPGIDPGEVIPSYPFIIGKNISLSMLWDNEVTQFIKVFVVKLFRRRQSQLK